MSFISLKLEFGGGLELLFSNQRTHAVTIPSRVPTNNRTDLNIQHTLHNNESKLAPLVATSGETKPADINFLIHHMRDHLLKEREELFMENDTVYVAFFVILILANRSLDVRAYSFWSTIPIGNLRAKAIMCSKMGTKLCLSPHSMEVELKLNLFPCGRCRTRVIVTYEGYLTSLLIACKRARCIVRRSVQETPSWW
jgi:ubiquitin related modifier 1